MSCPSLTCEHGFDLHCKLRSTDCQSRLQQIKKANRAGLNHNITVANQMLPTLLWDINTCLLGFEKHTVI